MKIISSDFQNNSKIPITYTCDGKNINPPLQFLDVPDAPAKVWVHWAIYNISPDVSAVEEDSTDG